MWLWLVIVRSKPLSVYRAYSRKWENACNFSEKGQKKGRKGQSIWKFGQKCTKFENILKKGSIACMKQLEYALAYLACVGKS